MNLTSKRIINVLLLILSFSYLSAFELQNAPKIQKRTAPSGSQTEIYSHNASIRNATKSVVNISTEKKSKNVFKGHPMFDDPFFKQFFGDVYGQIPQDRIDRSLGSGVIISSDGYIVTNFHVIDGADKIIVNLSNDKTEHIAKLVASDKRSDLAVIKIAKKGLPSISFASSSDVMIGDVVFAIGNPFGVGESVTQGIISAINKNGIGINEYENFIQTDASINPGNSGGALIDTRGALIGINTAIISNTGGNHGIGFALPSDMVAKITKQLIEKGSIKRGYLGVGIQDVTNELKDSYGGKSGAVLISIEPNGAAARAGLMVWDLITEINGKEIKSASELKNAIGLLSPNEIINIKFVREGKERSARLTLGVMPDGPKANAPTSSNTESNSKIIDGVSVVELNSATYQKYQIPKEISGVLITDIDEKSQAYAQGMRVGEIIAQIENIKIAKISDLDVAIKRFKGKNKRVLLHTQNGSKTIILK